MQTRTNGERRKQDLEILDIKKAKGTWSNKQKMTETGTNHAGIHTSSEHRKFVTRFYLFAVSLLE